MTPEEIESEALKLDLEVRKRLVDRLNKSLQELSENEKERIWLQEAMRRSRELRESQAAVGEGPDRDREEARTLERVEPPVTRPLASDALEETSATERPLVPSRRRGAAKPRKPRTRAARRPAKRTPPPRKTKTRAKPRAAPRRPAKKRSTPSRRKSRPKRRPRR